jgi:hypothetical protein
VLSFIDAIKQGALFGRSFLDALVKFKTLALPEVTETAYQLIGKFGTWFAALKEKGETHDTI